MRDIRWHDGLVNYTTPIGFVVSKLSEGKKRLHTFTKRKIVGGTMSYRAASQGKSRMMTQNLYTKNILDIVSIFPTKYLFFVCLLFL